MGSGRPIWPINLALDSRYAGWEVRVADLDIVNPYFRSSDYRRLLEDAGVQVIAPRYADTTLDAPAVSGQVSAALDWRAGNGEGCCSSMRAATMPAQRRSAGSQAASPRGITTCCT